MQANRKIIGVTVVTIFLFENIIQSTIFSSFFWKPTPCVFAIFTVQSDNK